MSDLSLSPTPSLPSNSDDGNTPLHWAAFTGDVEQVRQILQKEHSGIHINTRNHLHETSLHGACRFGHLQICQILLEAGADPKLQTSKGTNALHEACRGIIATSVHPEYAISVMKLLLARGVSVNDVDADGNTAIHIVCRGKRLHEKKSISKRALRLLLRAGAEVDVRNTRRCNPLHLAAMTGDPHLIAELCKHPKASILLQAQDSEGQSPLHWACYFGRVKIVELLLQHGANPSLRNYSMRTPLLCAINSVYTEKSLSKITEILGSKVSALSGSLRHANSPSRLNPSPNRVRSSPSKFSPSRYRLLASAVPGPYVEDVSPSVEKDSEIIVDSPRPLSNHASPALTRVVSLEQERRISPLRLCDEAKSDTQEKVCPLTMKPMDDPVLAADGNTYERNAIEEYLKNHNTSPVTGQLFHSNLLFPNPRFKRPPQE
eukprot:TRINITY_DN2348_c0_g2_i9.p1 TRINITY_DN2348_c0_g2~~TRINITY_DN2348_c0_g2_i9.p1  ORF type:complete len:433 (-),score=74.75 TRINITY_DN2348_c0_g2_i9:69-1367(-)